MRKLSTALITALVIFISGPGVALAQNITTLGIAQYVPIKGEGIKDGQLVSLTPKGYEITKTPYDASMIGVVSEKPAVSIEPTPSDGTYPVVSTGVTNVLVAGDAIAVGDLVTASSVPGVAMKATKSGFILGSAQEAFKPASPTEVGKIHVNLTLRYIVSGNTSSVVLKSLKDVVSFSTIASIESPIEIFRYVLAGFILVVSTGLSVFTFSRNASLGIEALGRNPRAGQKIILGIMINVLTSISIIGAGLVAAYFILALSINGN